ncbi:MAG: glycine cleavage system protein H [Clostridia bacterium]|nr:glycine cleavage system protein H [Clostridia bacterium]
MAKIDKYEMPDDLYYTRDHAWVKVEGNRIRIGVTDFMQQSAGEITFIRVPRVGKDLQAGKTLFTLQSGKWAGKIQVPMDGKVVEANKDLAANPKPLNADPYGQGWVAVMEPVDLQAGLSQLLHGDQVEPWLREEIAKHAR